MGYSFHSTSGLFAIVGTIEANIYEIEEYMKQLRAEFEVSQFLGDEGASEKNVERLAVMGNEVERLHRELSRVKDELDGRGKTTLAFNGRR